MFAQETAHSRSGKPSCSHRKQHTRGQASHSSAIDGHSWPRHTAQTTTSALQYDGGLDPQQPQVFWHSEAKKEQKLVGISPQNELASSQLGDGEGEGDGEGDGDGGAFALTVG